MGSALFGTRQTPAEELAAVRDALRAVVRDLAREAQKREVRAQDHYTRAKNARRRGNMASARQEAGFSAADERAVRRFRALQYQVEQQMDATVTHHAQAEMQRALYKTTCALTRVGRALPPAIFTGTLARYHFTTEALTRRQTLMKETFALARETADDALDDSDGGPETDAEEDTGDAVLARIDDELGLAIHEDMAALPATHSGPTVADLALQTRANGLTSRNAKRRDDED